MQLVRTTPDCTNGVARYGGALRTYQRNSRMSREVNLLWIPSERVPGRLWTGVEEVGALERLLCDIFENPNNIFVPPEEDNESIGSQSR